MPNCVLFTTTISCVTVAPPYRFGVRLWPGDYDNKRLKLRQNWLKFDQFFNRLDKYKYRTTKILKL